LHTQSVLRLTEGGADAIIAAAVDQAHNLGIPVCIALVDDGAKLLRFTRLAGAKIHVIESALAKARAAASNGIPTAKVGATGNELSDYHAIAITLACAPGAFITLPGGLPIVVNGACIGGIGVAGGTGDQDVMVGKAGLAVLS
jgi:glc operon protein GlcG